MIVIVRDWSSNHKLGEVELTMDELVALASNNNRITVDGQDYIYESYYHTPERDRAAVWVSSPRMV